MVYIIEGGTDGDDEAELGELRSGGFPPSLAPALRGPPEPCGASLGRGPPGTEPAGWKRAGPCLGGGGTAVARQGAGHLGETSRCPAGIAASGREKGTASPAAAALCSLGERGGGGGGFSVHGAAAPSRRGKPSSVSAAVRTPPSR
ncbi:translation initiation factor IF-2-like [Aquila chrysaetos chrysaetos]|uniref:translation initiation factor IF-2-like n=1 Tax=Aquila chrysaetos chrysaetos TaxID=223781 RepID=UPI001177129C|nr:translation initiation factor IF-2-like [Aquila chrysaetos chrysaetos]